MKIRKGDRYMSAQQVKFAEYLLKDGASYREVGRTIGCWVKVLDGIDRLASGAFLFE